MMNGRMALVTVLLYLLTAASAAAQTPEGDNEILDRILQSPQLTLEQACWLVFRSAGQPEEDFSPARALSLGAEKGWLSRDLEGTRPIPLDLYCHLIMEGLELRGGIFHTAFPGPRYAYRELVWRKAVPQGLPPDTLLTGEEALYILSKAGPEGQS